MLIAFTGIFTAVREKHGKSDVTVWNQLQAFPEVSKIGLVRQKCMKLNGTVQDQTELSKIEQKCPDRSVQNLTHMKE